MPDQPTSRFLSLPGELRNAIYRFLLDDIVTPVQSQNINVRHLATCPTDPSTTSYDLTPYLSLLLSNRQISHEISSICSTEYLPTLTWYFTHPSKLRDFAQRCSTPLSQSFTFVLHTGFLPHGSSPTWICEMEASFDEGGREKYPRLHDAHLNAQVDSMLVGEYEVDRTYEAGMRLVRRFVDGGEAVEGLWMRPCAGEGAEGLMVGMCLWRVKTPRGCGRVNLSTRRNFVSEGRVVDFLGKGGRES